MKIIENLKWQPRWVSHLGCIEGCIRYLKNKITTGWLYGGTGHAFVLNIANDLCPSGPTAWRPLMLFQLAHNLGFEIKGIFSYKTQSEFPKEQEKAWNFVKTSINNDTPCYGWELEIPEYYVIKGYDDVGYYISGTGCDDGKGPIKWQNLGTSDIGVIEMYDVHEVPKTTSEVVVKEALEKVLHHSTNPDEWIFENYSSGILGFDRWITAVQEGTALAMGLAYNTAVWAECRKYAVEFLNESKTRLPKEMKSLFENSVEQYSNVSKNLDKLSQLFPFSVGMSGDPIGVSQKSKDGTGFLKSARDAEEKGLESLRQIVKALE
ncbi:MAG: hypothetical protein ACXABN_02725 [Candidatus Thorarchaeota archaeon]